MAVSNRDLLADSKMVKQTCLCNVHVHRAAFVLGIISIALDVIQTLSAFLSASSTTANNVTLIIVRSSGAIAAAIVGRLQHNNAPNTNASEFCYSDLQNGVKHSFYATLLFNAVSIPAAGLMLLGLRKGRASFYKPFHVVVLISCAAQAVVALGCFGVAGYLTFAAPDDSSTMTMSDGGAPHVQNESIAALLVSGGLGVALAAVCRFYFLFIVVNRSRRLNADGDAYMIKSYSPA